MTGTAGQASGPRSPRPRRSLRPVLTQTTLRSGVVIRGSVATLTYSVEA